MTNFFNFFWKLRKFKYYFSKNIVLDVGSGGDPYISANVCFDKDIINSYLRDNDRTYASPYTYTVISNDKHLPFKTNFFGKTVLSHVIEYNRKPDELLKEIFRISKGGFLEGGNHQLFKQSYYPHMSLICNYESQNQFIIYKKQFSDDLCQDYFNDHKIIDIKKNHPESYHYRFEWEKVNKLNPFKIKYLNEDYEFNWKIPDIKSKKNKLHKKYIKNFLKNILVGLRSIFFKFNYADFLQCPSCQNDLIYNSEFINCTACDTTAKIKGKLIIFKNNAYK